MNRLRINNERFTIRFCIVAKTYGFKTVGSFKRFLDNLESPNVKLYFNMSHVRALFIIRELDEFIKTYPNTH